jgi:hypothetical protein
MKRTLKRILLGLLIVATLVTLLVRFFVHKPLPTGQKGPEAEVLAQKMSKAINQTAWDSTAWVKWGYVKNQYLWHKSVGKVLVMWGDTKVTLNTYDQTGTATEKGQILTGNAKEKALAAAWKRFCNDSFWLNAPAKINDMGTERSTVHGDDLMVQYKSGGVTPGDAYIWTLDPNGLPISYRMWVGIIPIGGLSATWEDWVTLPTGAKLATTHKLGGFTIKVTDLDGGMVFPGWP